MRGVFPDTVGSLEIGQNALLRFNSGGGKESKTLMVRLVAESKVKQPTNRQIIVCELLCEDRVLGKEISVSGNTRVVAVSNISKL